MHYIFGEYCHHIDLQCCYGKDHFILLLLFNGRICFQPLYVTLFTSGKAAIRTNIIRINHMYDCLIRNLSGSNIVYDRQA